MRMRHSNQILVMVALAILLASAMSAVNLNANSSGSQGTPYSSSHFMPSLGNATGINPSVISTYPVFFNETGLPTGALWTVNVSGLAYSSLNSSIRLNLAPGPYSYSIENSLNFYSPDPSGHFTVLNHSVNVNTKYNGRLSITGYVNLVTGTLTNSSSPLTTNRTVFPVYGIFDNFSHSFVVLGYSNSMIYEISQYNQSISCSFGGVTSPLAVDYNPSNGNLYVLNSTTVFVYAANGTILASHYFGKYLISVAFDPINGEIMVGNLYGGLYFLDPGTLSVIHKLSNIKVFSSQSFAYDSAMKQMEVINDSSPDGNIVFLNGNDSPVSVTSGTGTIMSVVFNSVTNSTYYIGFLNGNSYTYVINSTGNYKISGTGQSYGLGISKSLNSILATNTQNGTVELINASSNQLTYVISGTGTPLLPLSGPGNSTIFIINPTYNALDIVKANDFAVAVNFRENGLTQGTTWNVTVKGITLSSSGASTQFFETPGYYSYSVSQLASYISPQPGHFDAGIAQVNITVNFVRTYSVSFTENGLSPGIQWGMVFNGINKVSTAGQAIKFSAPNGTFAFNISSENGYSASPRSGYIVVDGNSVDFQVNYSMNTYWLKFVSAGVPSGTTWSMEINHILEQSDNSTLTYAATAGTYNYTVYPVHAYYPEVASGSVKVSDSNITVYIDWLPYLYKVNFSEMGLPAGLGWQVSISEGTAITSYGTNASAYLPDGTFSYVFTSLNSSWRGGSGLLTVNGSALQMQLNFTPVLFKVVFNENGLPLNTYWSVHVLNSGTDSSYGNRTFVYLQNGTYSYQAESSNTSFAKYSGNFMVKGSGVNLTVSFALVQFNVTFTESGLINGTQWGVFIPGSGNHSTNSTALVVSLPVGQHSYSPLPVAGYNASAGGYFLVENGNLTLPINFTLIKSTPAKYNVTIYEMGLPEGFQWAIILNNTMTVSYPEGDFNLQLINGTYNLSLLSINPHGKPFWSDVNITLSVNGTDQSVIVLFYGPYVWLVVDFGLCNSHAHHHNTDSHRDDNNMARILVAKTRSEP